MNGSEVSLALFCTAILAITLGFLLGWETRNHDITEKIDVCWQTKLIPYVDDDELKFKCQEFVIVEAP